MAPGRWQSLLLGASSTGHLITNTVARDAGFRRQPVYGEGVCTNVRENQFNRGIQDCSAEKRVKSNLLIQYKEICKENNSIDF